MERFREATNEQLDRVRWAIPAELERTRGAGTEDVERIRDEVARIAATVHEAIGQIPTFREQDPERVDGLDLARRIDEVLVAINRSTDRLADTIHRSGE
jgi:hypothetical protein